MDALHFDALSRRLTRGLNRRGLGLLALLGLPGLLAPDPAAGRKKKRKKKKRCPPCKRRKKGKCKGTQPDGSACPGGTCQSGTCQADPCPGQQLCEDECIPTDQCCTTDDCPGGAGYFCCDGECTSERRGPGSTCVFSNHNQCCSNYCRTSTYINFVCAATCRGKPCATESECCRGFSCESGLCGGCGDFGEDCANDADCCFSACTTLPGQSQKNCQSYAGGRCDKNIDCWPCTVLGDCTVTRNGTTRDICHNGACGCPYDCCSDADCAPAEFCAFDPMFGLRGTCMLRPQ